MGGGASSHAELRDDAPSAQKHAGVLLKESETLKAWNERYAVLERRVLRYWDTEAQCKAGEPPRATVSLAHCRVCLTPDNQLLIVTPSDRDRMVLQRGQSQLLFQAETNFALHTWLRKLRIASRCPWDADSATACRICNAPFSLLSRPHHCRRCGKVVCDKCSPATSLLVDYAYESPARVCTDCHGKSGPVPPPMSAAEAAAAAAAEEEAREAAAEAARAAELKKRASARADGEATAARQAKLREQLRGGGAGRGSSSGSRR